VTAEFLGTDCVGRIIDGRFTLLRWLGGTDQSSVFFTELEADPARSAAIKLIPADAADAEARIAQWNAATTLWHPHLMRLFDAGSCQVDGVDLLYVVSEYAEEVLSEILRERSLTLGETREMLSPVLEALTWLNERDLLHGHLKPSNIMVVDGKLKLSVDTLLAADEPARVSLSSGVYDAPEVAQGRISSASDVWSLGVVLVESLTQRTPRADRGEDPVVPSSIPPPFYGLARACLQVDPARRWPLGGIKNFLQDPDPKPAPKIAAATRPSQAQPSQAGPARAPRSRTPFIVGGAVLLIAVIVAALVLGSHHRPSSPAPTQTQATQPESPAPAATPPQGSVVKGAVAFRANPEVPQSIRDTITGHIRVHIAVQVDASGNVADATIDVPGPSRYFANRAFQAARGWRFTPAAIGGHAVPSKWMLQFYFGQDGTTVTPTETSP
jgi:TonB family protein